MNIGKKICSICLNFAVITAISSCGNGDLQAEANNLIGEANEKIAVVKELLTTTDNRNKTLFGANIQTIDELAEYKKAKHGEAKSIIANYEKTCELLKEISKIFDAVSRMNIHPKYREYTKLKADEFAARAEAVSVRKGNVQAFIEIDDPQKMTARFDENNTKSDKIFGEAEEIARRARTMEIENQSLFVNLK